MRDGDSCGTGTLEFDSGQEGACGLSNNVLAS